ncbi:MAG: excalibur calcium-binding domain-containing protein, partial [Anaerorhabdus sp.]|uniref:excalibur calcium-binding domain-containing protein n=1 Tax=Anaerorhabdus sp. TaxID=1872524 RepID=UPI002FC97776
NGNDKLLFTGDASSTVEDLLNIGDIDLLKVSHHGSKTGTSTSFLDKVQPEIAVICVGKDNTYGHPNQEVMDKLQMREIPVYRTDENGDILFISSGNGISTQNSQGSYSAGNVEKNNSTPTPTPVATPKPTPTPKPVTTPVPEQPKQEENVQQDTSYQTNFANCTELKKVYPDGVGQDHPAYRSKMDRDKDGWACE